MFLKQKKLVALYDNGTARGNQEPRCPQTCKNSLMPLGYGNFLLRNEKSNAEVSRTETPRSRILALLAKPLTGRQIS
jgi:hypothetical protein